MGTETKFNCYTENTLTASPNAGAAGVVICNRRERKGLTNGALTQQQQNGTGIYHNGKGNTCSNRSNDNKEQPLNGSAGAAAAAVPSLPILVDENNVIDGAKEILKLIRPHWNLEGVHYKKFTDGITNKLVGCFYNGTDTDTDTGNTNGSDTTSNGHRNGSSSNGHGQRQSVIGTSSAGVNSGANNGISPTPSARSQGEHSDDDNNDSGNLSDDADTVAITARATADAGDAADNVVLVRVYGNKTDLLIDRKAETRNILLLHSYGFAPSLYATFKNGLAYDYVPGVTLNASNIREPAVWQLVARRMADMHRLVRGGGAAVPAGERPVPMLWRKTQAFLDLVPERFSDADKQKRVEGTFLPIEKLREEFVTLYRHLETLDSPLVFAHNDLLLGNVVYTESQQSVSFIDYEYADFNFQAFDIGNHFAEFAGVDVVDYARYPQRDFQLEWLRVYLQTYLQRSTVSAAELERLYVQVNQFALASHIFWTIWSLIQAEHSTIDFDYVGYAFMRYNEYLAKKDEFLAMEMKPALRSATNS